MDNLPPPIQVIQGDGKGSDGSKDDDSLVDIKVKNPFQKFFEWIRQFIKKQSTITIKIPIIGIVIALSSFGIGLGSGYNWGFNTAVSKFFPDSSPIFHRAISVEGVIQKSSLNNYYLKSGDNYTWTLKPGSSAVNLADYVNEQVIVKGNLTKEKSVIEVSEVISSAESVIPQASPISVPQSQSELGEASPEAGEAGLPTLYSGLQWETTQRRVLIFTSGKRKIEQEGLYLESAQLTDFPQDFINYYIEQLKAQKFKETLNSISPEGITVTYAKDDLFLTFGIKNIYKGSKDQQLVGYKAFIEHN